MDLGSLDQINAGTLSGFEITMQSDWAAALNAAAEPPQTFPESGPGFQIVIDNLDVIAALKKNYKARFPIPAVTSSVTLAQSPFAGRCNVRITKVRPWLVGARAIANDGLIQVTIGHLGRESAIGRQHHVPRVRPCDAAGRGKRQRRVAVPMREFCLLEPTGFEPVVTMRQPRIGGAH